MASVERHGRVASGTADMLVGGDYGSKEMGNHLDHAAHLLALCDAHEGHLVTFDRGVAELGDAASAPVSLLAP